MKHEFKTDRVIFIDGRPVPSDWRYCVIDTRYSGRAAIVAQYDSRAACEADGWFKKSHENDGLVFDWVNMALYN
jgi:hypothetical protein